MQYVEKKHIAFLLCYIPVLNIHLITMTTIRENLHFNPTKKPVRLYH